MLILIVTLLRLLIPLLIFRYFSIGFIASFFLDAVDLDIIQFFGGRIFPSYQFWDKTLDTYYLSMAMLFSLSWKNELARQSSVILFFYRVIGVVLFVVTGYRALLFFFPNLFEFFFIFYLLYLHFFKTDPIYSLKNLMIILVILLIPKLVQEYILHFAQLHFWEWFSFLKLFSH